jgi:hypothetical protein
MKGRCCLDRRIPESEWVWCGQPGHLIVSYNCCFRLHTVIGDYKISTVGCYHPMGNTSKLETVGLDRHFETYVFDTTTEDSYLEIDSDRLFIREDDWETVLDIYYDRANQMHLAMCRKYAAIRIPNL